IIISNLSTINKPLSNIDNICVQFEFVENHLKSSLKELSFIYSYKIKWRMIIRESMKSLITSINEEMKGMKR
ncbi:hypothetical protein, partial [Clostridium perfringens]|uniref:hypothetical protein n=1 Tax=Clostridium perfringens TaxID=1502 RepID=UPI003754E7E6